MARSWRAIGRVEVLERERLADGYGCRLRGVDLKINLRAVNGQVAWSILAFLGVTQR